MRSPAPSGQPIVVTLTPSIVTFVPGDPPMDLTVEVSNMGNVVDEFTIEIEGLDPTWYTLDAHSVSLFPGDNGQITLRITLPRGMGAVAGEYPFVLRARSEDAPTRFAQVNGVVQVETQSSFDIALQPRRVTGRRGNYRITLSNRGNRKLQLSLGGHDADDALQYNFRNSDPVLDPGETATVPLEVKAPGLGFVGPHTTYNFTINAIPVGASASMPTSPHLSEAAGQLVRTTFLRSLRGLMLALLLVALLLVILLVRPDVCRIPGLSNLFCPAPQITNYVANKQKVTAGEPVTLRWETKNAVKAEIAEDAAEVPIGADGRGETVVTPTQDRSAYTLCVTNGSGEKLCRPLQLVVENVAGVGPPSIILFVATPLQVTPGQPVTLRWEAKNAVKAEIAEDAAQVPLGTDGKGTLVSKPTQARTYTLCVSNAAGDKVCQPLQVAVEGTTASGQAGAPTVVAGGGQNNPGGGAGAGGSPTAGTGGSGNGGAGGNNPGGGGTPGGAGSGGAGAGATPTRAVAAGSTTRPPAQVATPTLTGGAGGVGGANQATPTRPAVAAQATPTQPAAAAQPTNTVRTAPPPSPTRAVPIVPPATPTPAVAVAGCDPGGAKDGKANPVNIAPGGKIVFEASGFTPGEGVSFWYTAPDGRVLGSPAPLASGLRPDGSTGQFAVTIPTDFTKAPGRWVLTLQGDTSNHESLIPFCVTPK